MVCSTLVVSDASHSGSYSRGLVGAVPAALATAADGCCTGRESKCTKSVAGGAAALVRDALVVSARRRRKHAAIDDANSGTDDSGGYDAASATGFVRYDKASATNAA